MVWVGLLYDLFYYDWWMIKFDLGMYVFIYFWVVFCNVEKIMLFFNKEKDIILKYMFGVIVVVFCYWESLIVFFVDDYEVE